MTQATVALRVPLDGRCMVDTLRSQPHVAGFRGIREGGAPTYWFEITDPALAGKGPPAFLAREKVGSDGPVFEITSSFRAGRGAAALRKTVMQRQQLMLSRVFEKCVGRPPRFGPARVCGKGEENTLCVEGEIR
jgi:hypothetical protein